MPPPEPGTAPPHPEDTELVDDRNDVVLRRIVIGPLWPDCWAVHATGDTQALLIDPGAEPGRILAAVDDLHITGIVLTHAHFDHLLAVPQVVDALGVPVYAHPDDAPVWPHELATLATTGRFDAGTATTQLLAGGHTLRPDRTRTCGMATAITR